MDGSGRWAEQRGWPRYFGHIRGVQTLRRLILFCASQKIPYLSVFAFSTENWKRPSKEVEVLMKLIGRAARRYKKSLDENNIRFFVIGSLKELDPNTQKDLKDLIEHTKNNSGLKLITAINYGGRREIAVAARTLAEEVKTGNLPLEDIDEACIEKRLDSSIFPPPDLIIRTGGVSRLSNFYLWQAAYSEFYVSPLLWPDFNEEELKKALNFYTKTDRRFGRV